MTVKQANDIISGDIFVNKLTISRRLAQTTVIDLFIKKNSNF